jgi:hypothetical protein
MEERPDDVLSDWSAQELQFSLDAAHIFVWDWNLSTGATRRCGNAAQIGRLCLLRGVHRFFFDRFHRFALAAAFNSSAAVCASLCVRNRRGTLPSLGSLSQSAGSPLSESITVHGKRASTRSCSTMKRGGLFFTRPLPRKLASNTDAGRGLRRS